MEVVDSTLEAGVLLGCVVVHARSVSPQLELTLGPLFVVEVEERFSPGLTGRSDRSYASPPQPRDDALALAALLLDAVTPPEGDGPWHRALAGGRRTVRLAAAPAGAVW